jgi:hypothetical protein
VVADGVAKFARVAGAGVVGAIKISVGKGVVVVLDGICVHFCGISKISHAKANPKLANPIRTTMINLLMTSFFQKAVKDFISKLSF